MFTKVITLVCFLGLLAAGSIAIADDNPCRFIRTVDNHQVNPRHVAIVQSLTIPKMETGSNMQRFKIYLVMVSGQRVLFNSYDLEYNRGTVISALKDRIEHCFESLEKEASHE